MSKEITVTGTRYSQKGEIAQIYGIWKEIFPEKIEQKYAELANLISLYTDAAIDILNGNKTINNISKKLNRNEEIRNKNDFTIEEMINLLEKMKNQKVTIDELKILRKQMNNLEDSFRMTVSVNDEEESLEQRYDENRFLSGNAHNKIMGLISQIEVKIEEINDLSIDKEDRLDRIQVTDKHLSEIDNIQNLAPKAKEIVKKLIQEYTKLRVSAFKSSVEYAHEICSAYHSHEIIDYYNQKDSRVVKDRLIFSALYTLEYDFYDKLTELTDLSKNFEEFYVNRSACFIQLMQWYTSCLSGELIDINKVIEFQRNNPYYINTVPAGVLCEANAINQIKNLESNYHK